MSIRNTGFGLNYNQGFRSMGTGGRYGGGGGGGMDTSFAQNYMQGQRQGRQFDANLALQRDQLNQQGALAREAQANQINMARMQADASTLAERNKQGFRQQLFPTFLSLLKGGGMGGARGGLYNQYTGGGQIGQQPYISDAPVYNNQQIQEQVNAQRAQGDAAVAAQNAAAAKNLAGKGFGSRSPLAMAMASQRAMANLGANTQAENDLRFQAAKANADQVLKAQLGREGQFAARQDEDIKRNQQQASMLSSILSSFGSFF